MVTLSEDYLASYPRQAVALRDRQLAQQKITFKAADALTDEEKQAPCLVETSLRGPATRRGLVAFTAR